MPVSSKNRALLEAMSSDIVALNDALQSQRVEIRAATASASEAKATIRNESDDPELRQAVDMADTLSAKINDLTTSLAEVNEAIDERVASLYASREVDPDLENKRKAFVAGRKDLFEKLNATRVVAPNIVGEGTFDEYLVEIGFDEVKNLSGGSKSGKAANVTGIKRPRLSSLFIDDVPITPPTFTDAAAHIRKTTGLVVAAGDISASLHGDVMAGPAVWTYVATEASGNTRSFVISSTPRPKRSDVSDDVADDDN